MIDFFRTKHLDKLIEIPDFIYAFHKTEFQITDVIDKDLYRRMNDKGLFDYNFIHKGTRGKNNPSKTNLVFLTWIMMVKDLKAFGLKIDQLLNIKNYLFKEFDISDLINFPLDKESLLKRLNDYEFEDAIIKTELENNIKSGKFLNSVKDERVSRLFLYIYKQMVTGRDIQLHVDSLGNCVFIDETDLSNNDLEELSYESRIVLPLKKYFFYFIGEYAPIEYLTRSRILTYSESKLLEEFRRNDILNLTIKYKNGKPNTYEARQYKKIQLQNKISNTLTNKDYEDITFKAKNGKIYYAEQTKRVKL